MKPGALLQLGWHSVIAPREVARLLLSLRPSHEVLLLGFALVVVLNALVFGAATLLSPSAAGTGLVMISPVIFLLTLSGALGATVLALTWTGRALGGRARIEDIALLLIWMQALRLVVQVAMLVIVPLSTGLAALLVVAASAAGVWILVHFLDEAHHFASPLRALLVLLLGVTGTALGLALFLSLIGATTMGLNGYV
ncbi:YIP1 family protein [Puniceibacterium confluentis]|uniref:YIP1 family protein n=1 Tax=Puniceibacterium confluentis TaxID=1958944 RepID=UPI0011B4813C|nr:YIP1 family protein [Puniceibacterium confluentis]